VGGVCDGVGCDGVGWGGVGWCLLPEILSVYRSQLDVALA
jgi:hypothetical protein